MEVADREKLIDLLNRSFYAMPKWAQTACLHGSGTPTKHPETGEPFATFGDALKLAADETLTTLKEDFECNGDLLPE